LLKQQTLRRGEALPLYTGKIRRWIFYESQFLLAGATTTQAPALRKGTHLRVTWRRKKCAAE